MRLHTLHNHLHPALSHHHRITHALAPCNPCAYTRRDPLREKGRPTSLRVPPLARKGDEGCCAYVFLRPVLKPQKETILQLPCDHGLDLVEGVV